MKRLAFIAAFFVLAGCYTEPKTVAGLKELDIRACYHFHGGTALGKECLNKVVACEKAAGDDVAKYKNCVGY